VPPLDISHQPLSACLAGSHERTAGTGDALLMSWQQPCTSPTIRAGVQVISTCGWLKICSGVCSSGDVHVLVPTNVKLKVISPKILIARLKLTQPI